MQTRRRMVIVTAALMPAMFGSGLAAAAGESTPTTPAVQPAANATATTPPPVPDWVHDPDCVRVVRPGESVSRIAAELTPPVATSALLTENSIGGEAVIHPGELLDVCIANDVDDVSGASRARPDTTLIADHVPGGVKLQQQKLNELFERFGIRELAVDGISGPLTRQQLCAARVLLGLPISRSDMAIGGSEEAELMAMTSVPIPPGAPRRGSQWVLIDMTCQVLFAGNRDGVRFIFPTSTGENGFETRVLREVSAFRFDPALENDGWHDSTEYPASYDNPLNGNMYKPIYFDDGQAIHGANNVPTSPASKGCVRLLVDHHDHLVAWLGLGDASAPVWRTSEIGLTVTTQGAYKPDP